MDKPFQVVPDIVIFPAHFPIPGMGFMPVNAFVIKAEEPVLVDAGMGMESDDFMAALESIIDPKEIDRAHSWLVALDSCKKDDLDLFKMADHFFFDVI